MITKATKEQATEVKNLWKVCFPQEDEGYIDYYFKNLFVPENCFVYVEEGHVVSAIIRAPHAMMFNDKVLRTSMILGVGTLPAYRKRGYMKRLMEIVLDACEHTELITLIQAYDQKLYEPYGFRNIYNRSTYRLTRDDVKRSTNFGCSYEPTAIDLLKVYSAFIRRFNGYYARDLEYFVKYKKEINAQGGKIVAYYNGKDQIRGYATMLPKGDVLEIEELIYLDSTALLKLCNETLFEKDVVELHVSEAEDLTLVFPETKVETYGSTMARLNDAKLFSKLVGRDIATVEQAFATSIKPLNLNEFA